MATINDSISRVRTLLLNPKEQKPSLDQLFTQLTYEYQAFYSELENTNLPWTYNEQVVQLSNLTDYLVSNPTGRVLFVTATPDCNCHGSIPLEIADLADVSSNYWLFCPLDLGYSRDFNERGFWPHHGYQIAFYRKEGDLYFRLAPDLCPCGLASVTIVYSTGDWLDNLDTNSSAMLSQHHQLPETRTAMNLLPGAEWDEPEADQVKRSNLDRSLSRQMERYATNFLYAKRSITADQPSFRGEVYEW